MHLAKNSIDIAIVTNQIDAQLEFWQNKVGLAYEELLKVSKDMHQHRLSLNGSVFKLNHALSSVPGDAFSGYRELLIVNNDLENVENIEDPDGNRVTLVPHGYRDVRQIGLVLQVASVVRAQRYYEDVLGLSPVSESVMAWGDTLFFFNEQADTQGTEAIAGLGYRYITVQIHDLLTEYSAALSKGGIEGMAPVRMGDTAKFAFLRDPDGNWIEVSQRASLAGSLD